MNEDFEAYLSIFFVSLTFVSAILYFIQLYKFSIHVRKVNPTIWNDATKKGRTRESIFSTGYRVLSSFSRLQESGTNVDGRTAILAKHTKIAQMLALTFFTIIFVGGLYMSMNKG